MNATVVIREVPDCEAKRLFDAPSCRYLQMLEGCVGIPKRSIVIKYRHQEHEFIRVLGAHSKETKCLRSKPLMTRLNVDQEDEYYVGEMLCRVLQKGESFTITVNK